VRISIKKLQRQLDVTRRIPLTADDPETRIPERHVGVSEPHMVERIEKLGTELDVEAAVFTETVVLKEADVEIVYAVVTGVG
jgi:hypothetical protein